MELNGVTLVHGDWYWVLEHGSSIPVAARWWEASRVFTTFTAAGVHLRPENLRVIQRIEWPML